MDYHIKEEDIMDLKIEENSAQYLFNSLLDIGQLQQQSAHEQSEQPYCFFDKNQSHLQKSRELNYQETIVHQLSHIYNLRTTPLPQLMAYAEQAYEPSESVKRALFSSLKKIKMQLKRDNAKKRSPQPDRSEEYIEDIKVEDNVLQSFGFEDESQETKKKKRNRMSAQKSRDRKKQYIKQIQKINKELKRKIEELNSQHKRKVKPASRQFVKVLLCLGITCFLNTTPQVSNCSQELVEEERPSTETITTCEGAWPSKVESKLDLEIYKKLLPSSQQNMLEEVLLTMSHGEEPIDVDIQPQMVEDPAPPNVVVQERGRKMGCLGDRSASSCSAT